MAAATSKTRPPARAARKAPAESARPPEGRLIFRWHDGTRSRASDPLAVRRALTDGGADLFALFHTLEKAEEVARLPLGPEMAAEHGRVVADAAADLAALCRTAFGLPAFGETPEGGTVGLTDAECVALLAGFFNYLTSLEEQARPLPSSPSGSAQPRSANCPTK